MTVLFMYTSFNMDIYLRYRFFLSNIYLYVFVYAISKVHIWRARAPAPGPKNRSWAQIKDLNAWLFSIFIIIILLFLLLLLFLSYSFTYQSSSGALIYCEELVRGSAVSKWFGSAVLSLNFCHVTRLGSILQERSGADQERFQQEWLP